MKHYGNIGWRAGKFEIGIGITTIVFLLFLSNYECDTACAEWDYVSDVLLPELDSNADPAVWRWTNPSAIGVEQGSAQEILAVKGAVWEINQLLSATTMQVNYSEDVTQNGIGFTFVSRAEFEQIASPTQQDELSDARGFWFSSDQKNGRLNNGTIYIFTDQSEGSKWGTILHELGHSLGLLGHTDRYLSSLYYSSSKGSSWSDGFSSDDRKLLHFLYTHLKPGYGEIETREAFSNHWKLRAD